MTGGPSGIAGGGWGLLRSFWLYRRPGRQRGLRKLYRAFVRPGDLVFDVGAHLGDRTRAFRALGARVVAVEPQPRLLPWLRRLAARDPAVTVLGVALGPRVGTAELAVSRRHPTVSTLAEGWRERLSREHPGFRGVRWDERVRVPVTTLDALLREYGVPAFCKIDVEGFEAEVLAGLGTPIPALSVEWLRGGTDVAEACIDRLETLGPYHFNAIPGEERRFVFPEWGSAAAIRRWLGSAGSGISSGDLYACLDPRGLDAGSRPYSRPGPG